MPVQPTYTLAEFRGAFPAESDTVEFKEGLGAGALQEVLVALSNTSGGVVFLGVRDDGSISGRSFDDAIADRIHEIALSARDLGRYTISEVKVGDRPTVAIEVTRREEGFAQASDGRVLNRRGARNVALYGQDLARFLQQRALRRFELTDSGIHIRQVDEARLREVEEAFSWSAENDIRDRLREQGLLTADENLTIAGALFLTDPTTSLGQSKAVVEIRRYPGEGPDYDRRTAVSGPLQSQVREATRFVVDELGVDLVVTGLFRHELPRLREVVVREAIANAVAHRSYETTGTAIVIEMRPESVTVTSPGGLPEPVTVATMRDAQSARNPDVIDVLRRFHLAEDAGRGIDVIEDEMADALLDPPQFSDEGGSVKVVLPLHGPITPRERAWVGDLERRGEIAVRDRLLLVHAARGERLTNARARQILGAEESVARTALQRLRDSGLLRQTGARGGTSYVLADEVAPPAAFRMTRVEVEQLVIEEARDRPIGNADVRSLTGLDRRQATDLLARLVRSEQLERTGSKRGTRYRTV